MPSTQIEQTQSTTKLNYANKHHPGSSKDHNSPTLEELKGPFAHITLYGMNTQVPNVVMS